MKIQDERPIAKKHARRMIALSKRAIANSGLKKGTGSISRISQRTKMDGPFLERITFIFAPHAIVHSFGTKTPKRVSDVVKRHRRTVNGKVVNVRGFRRTRTLKVNPREYIQNTFSEHNIALLADEVAEKRADEFIEEFKNDTRDARR